MKVLHVPFCYYPDQVGGTEIYVHTLCAALQALDIDVVIAAPAETDQSYSHENVQVRRYKVDSEIGDISEIYGQGNASGATHFGRILQDEHPDIVHLHALTRGVSVLVAREAKNRNIPVVFTYHTPTVSCMRGTLLRWGTVACDGHVRSRRCTSCTLQNQGLDRMTSTSLSVIPPVFGSMFQTLGLSGGVWTALRMSDLVKLRQETFYSMMASVDRIVVLCQWTKDLLNLNEIPEDKVILCRHGLSSSPRSKTAQSVQNDSKPGHLRLVFLGRIDPTKGIHILIEALASQPQIDLILDIFGTFQPGSNKYHQQIFDLAQNDRRIRFLPSIDNPQVISMLGHYDCLVAPSQWLETGPLVVLEAFAASIPVIGSNLGGIAELVQHEQNGLLVEPPSSVSAWIETIQRLVDEPALLRQLRLNVVPPQSMTEVAHQMWQLYASLLGES